MLLRLFNIMALKKACGENNFAKKFNLIYNKKINIKIKHMALKKPIKKFIFFLNIFWAFLATCSLVYAATTLGQDIFTSGSLVVEGTSHFATSTANYFVATSSLINDLNVTGKGDFSQANFFALPSRQTPLLTNNQIAIDDLDGTLNFNANGQERVLSPLWHKTINIENATVTDASLKFRIYIDRPLVITKVVAVGTCENTTTGCSIGMEFNLKSSSDLSAAGNNLFLTPVYVHSTTTAQSWINNFATNFIPAGSYLWFDPIAASTTQITNLSIDLLGYQVPPSAAVGI